jgi:hypothetical protein
MSWVSGPAPASVGYSQWGVYNPGQHLEPNNIFYPENCAGANHSQVGGRGGRRAGRHGARPAAAAASASASACGSAAGGAPAPAPMKVRAPVCARWVPTAAGPRACIGGPA